MDKRKSLQNFPYMKKKKNFPYMIEKISVVYLQSHYCGNRLFCTTCQNVLSSGENKAGRFVKERLTGGHGNLSKLMTINGQTDVRKEPGLC